MYNPSSSFSSQRFVTTLFFPCFFFLFLSFSCRSTVNIELRRIQVYGTDTKTVSAGTAGNYSLRITVIKQTEILLQPRMPEGKQGCQPEKMVGKGGQQNLLQRSGQCLPCAGVAKQESRILEKTESKAGTVTRSLNRE